MKNWLNQYFGFTKREYNGLMVLLTILLLVSVLPFFYKNYWIKPDPVTAEERQAIAQLVLISEQKPKFQYASYEEDESNAAPIYFKFDPNKIDMADWQKLGLSKKQAKSIINYRDKGGKFFRAEDLKKMYTISPEKYEQLEPYIAIVKVEKSFYDTSGPKPSYVKKEKVIIEINGADTLQLDQIKGVGAAFARRIAKYRDRLGGFYRKEQLLEVFGVDSIKYDEIKDQIVIDVNKIQRINLNTAEFETFKNHPYLTYKQINAILQYRKQHGNYKNIDDLRKVVILNPQNIQNLLPYLIF
jgi:competence protein ComEA